MTSAPKRGKVKLLVDCALEDGSIGRKDKVVEVERMFGNRLVRMCQAIWWEDAGQRRDAPKKKAAKPKDSEEKKDPPKDSEEKKDPPAE